MRCETAVFELPSLKLRQVAHAFGAVIRMESFTWPQVPKIPPAVSWLAFDKSQVELEKCDST